MLQGPAFTSATLLSRSFYTPRNNSSSPSSAAAAVSIPCFPPPEPSCESNIKTRVRIVPSLDTTNRCVVFNIIDRELTPGTIVRIGRFTDRGGDENRLTFKSKVVSRSHCEIWVDQDGKVKQSLFLPLRFSHRETSIMCHLDLCIRQSAISHPFQKNLFLSVPVPLTH